MSRSGATIRLQKEHNSLKRERAAGTLDCVDAEQDAKDPYKWNFVLSVFEHNSVCEHALILGPPDIASPRIHLTLEEFILELW